MKKIGNFLVYHLFCLVLLITSSFANYNISGHPRVVVNNGDKAAILNKIKNFAWAESIFKTMKSGVETYVLRHTKDPEWILSRYAMNRIPGKYFTDFYDTSNGDHIRFDQQSGNAPVPTIRVMKHKRTPVAPDGYPFRSPSLDDFPPYNTNEFLRMQTSGPSKLFYVADPQAFGNAPNGTINNLALNAAIIYWLTGEEKYGKFALDIVWQFANAAQYQNPIHFIYPGRGNRDGFLCIQTLNDAGYLPLFLAYDFIFDLYTNAGYSTSVMDNVLMKFASNKIVAGFVNNNWMAAEAASIVYPALIIEDSSKREYLLSYFIERDNILPYSVGQKSLPTIMGEWFTADGFWKEPAGYHNYPVSFLLDAAAACEKNGIPIFTKHPDLFKAAYIMTDYLFPDNKSMGFGDSSRVGQNASFLEITLPFAERDNHPLTDRLRLELDQMITSGRYSRNSAGWRGLLTYLPVIKKPSSVVSRPASGELEFAGMRYQRNGTDKEYGLMFEVNGGRYNHAHSHGPSIELYGRGLLLGVDAGIGVNYDTPFHKSYYSQWAGHNTVVVNGQSRRLGSGPNISPVLKTGMEPLPGYRPLNDNHGFTDVYALEKSTSAMQKRLTAIVRTSDKSGYYFDVFRSAGTVKNEYLYHNIGHNLDLLDANDLPLFVSPSVGELEEKYLVSGTTDTYAPGYAWFTNREWTGTTPVTQTINARFTTHTENSTVYMDVRMPGQANRQYFKVLAPRTTSANDEHETLLTPTLVARQIGEAWNRPFIAIYEPYRGVGNNTVQSVKSLPGIPAVGGLVAVAVTSKLVVTGTIVSNILFNHTNSAPGITNSGFIFGGNYGVITYCDIKLSDIYLGQGRLIGVSNVLILSSTDGQNIAASMEWKEDGTYLSSDQPVTVTLFVENKDEDVSFNDIKLKYSKFGKYYLSENHSWFPDGTGKRGMIRATFPALYRSRIVTTALAKYNEKTMNIEVLHNKRVVENEITVYETSSLQAIITGDCDFSLGTLKIERDGVQLSPSSYEVDFIENQKITVQFSSPYNLEKGNYIISISENSGASVKKIFNIKNDGTSDKMKIFPNPYSYKKGGNLTIRFYDKEESEINIALLNVQGGVVLEGKLEKSSGIRTTEFTSEMFENANVARGIYFVCVGLNSDKSKSTISTKLIIGN